MTAKNARLALQTDTKQTNFEAGLFDQQWKPKSQRVMMCPLYHFAGFVGRERSRPLSLSGGGHGAQAEGPGPAVRVLLLHGEDEHAAARVAPAEDKNFLLLLEVINRPLSHLLQ